MIQEDDEYDQVEDLMTRAINAALLAEPRKGVYSVTENKKWAFNLGRFLRFESEIQPEYAYKVFSTICQRYKLGDEFSATYYGDFDNGYTSSKYPRSAFKTLASAAENFCSLGTPKCPAIINAGGLIWYKLWIILLIVGYSGRQFEFPRNKISEALNLSSNTPIQNFINALTKAGVINCVAKGRPGRNGTGVADKFTIVDDKWISHAIHLRPQGSIRSLAGWQKQWISMLNSKFKWLGIEFKRPRKKTLF